MPENVPGGRAGSFFGPEIARQIYSPVGQELHAFLLEQGALDFRSAEGPAAAQEAIAVDDAIGVEIEVIRDGAERPADFARLVRMSQSSRQTTVGGDPPERDAYDQREDQV